MPSHVGTKLIWADFISNIFKAAFARRCNINRRTIVRDDKKRLLGVKKAVS